MYKNPRLSASQILALKSAVYWSVEQFEQFGVWPKFSTLEREFDLTRTTSRHAIHLAERVREGSNPFPTPRPSGILCFVHSPSQNAVKIIYTVEAHLNKRMVALQDGNPAALHLLATMSASYETKAEIEQRFLALLWMRHWYRYREPLISFIANLK